MLEEAYQAGLQPNYILFNQQVSIRGQTAMSNFIDLGVEVVEIDTNLMKSLTDTENSQGVLAVFPGFELQIPENPTFVLILDTIRDPGNLGTILRTASAVGVQAVLLTHGTVDAFSPKVLRAGMGAHFYLPIHTCGWEDILEICQTTDGSNLKLYLAGANGDLSFWDVDFKDPLAIIMGGEAEGASKSAHLAADAVVNIPMPGGNESLNAGISAGIILYEALRQRRAL